MKNAIKTVDVSAKEWFDKVNGNSYFSATVTVNFGLAGEQTIYVPYQYGYGTQYEYTAFKALQDAELIPKHDTLYAPWRYYQENNIISRNNIQTGCKKKEVLAHGCK